MLVTFPRPISRLVTLLWALPKQRVDDRAVRHRTSLTLGGHFLQYPSHSPQIGDLALDLAKMIQGQGLDLAAAVIAAVHQPQKTAHLFQGEPQLPTPADEGEPLEEILVIEPVAARAARRIGHEAGALIITDGFDVHPSAF